MAKVDIIIPCYNYGRFLESCVRSVLDQSVKDIRVLIIDDASSDDSVAVARRLADADPRVSVIAHARNMGHIATYNEGIAWASSDYFLLLSADDMLAPGALERAVAIMDRDEDVVLTHGRSINWNDSYPLPEIEPEQDDRWSRQDLVRETCRVGRNLVSTPTAIGRTSVQKRIGGYDATLPHTADMEMWLRYGTCGAVARIEAVQAIYRLHGSNMSSNYYDAEGADLPHRKQTFDCFFRKYPNLPARDELCNEVNRVQARTALMYGLSRIWRGQIAEGLKNIRISASLSPMMLLKAPLIVLRHIALKVT
jgi:glycosyltransferase involved in cell wall biosynthesis